MSTFRALAGGRAWMARLLVLLTALALTGLAVAVLPASATHTLSPPSTRGIDPDKLQTVGGDFANCIAAEAHEGLPAGTITHFAFHNNPSHADQAELQVTDPNGVPYEGPTAEATWDWEVKLAVPDPDGHSQSLAYAVLNLDDPVPGQADGKLEAPRKQADKTENLSHVTFCFSEVSQGVLALLFVEVKGSQGTNHYDNVTTLNCNEATLLGDDGIEGRIFPVCDQGESKGSFFTFDGTVGDQSVSYATVEEATGFVATLEEWTWVPEDLGATLPPLEYDDGLGAGVQTAEFCESDPRVEVAGEKTFALPANLTAAEALAVLPAGHTTCIIEVTAVTVGPSGEVAVTHVLFTIGDPDRFW